MPASKFAVIFAIVFVAAMLTVGGGALMAGDTGITRATIAPVVVVLWLIVRLRERRRK